MNLAGLFSVEADSGEFFSEQISRNNSLDSNKKKRKYTSKISASTQKLRRKTKEKKKTAIKSRVISKAFSTGCCSETCLDGVNKDQAATIRMWFHSDGKCTRREIDKGELLRDIIAGGVVRNSGRSGSRSKMYYCVTDSTIENVCSVAMMKILGCSRGKWNAVVQQLAAAPTSGRKRSLDTMYGGGNIMYGRDSIVRPKSFLSAKEEKIYKFLESVKKKFAECLPNSKNFDLPSNFSPFELRRMFEQEYGTSCTKSYFAKIWKVMFIP